MVAKSVHSEPDCLVQSQLFRLLASLPLREGTSLGIILRIKLDNPCKVLSEVLDIYLVLNKYSSVSLRREENMELKGEENRGREKEEAS